MPAIRSDKKRNPYIMIDKAAIQNPNLSWRAKGLLAYMLSMPDDWIFHESELEKHAPDGKHILRQTIKELTTAGHIQKRAVRVKGKIQRWETVVTERFQPDSDFPQCGKSDTTNNDYVLSKKKKNVYTHLAKLRDAHPPKSFDAWKQISTGTIQHDADDFIFTYITTYETETGKIHPPIPDSTINKIRNHYSNWIISVGYRDIEQIILKWFNDPTINSNYHISHFTAYVNGMEKRIRETQS